MTFHPAWAVATPLLRARAPSTPLRTANAPPRAAPRLRRRVPHACEPVAADPEAPVATAAPDPVPPPSSSSSSTPPQAQMSARRRAAAAAAAAYALQSEPIPGPRPLPVVGNALDVLDSPLSELMLRYALNHGPFVKFSIVADVMHLVSDPPALQHVLATNAKNYLDRWTPPGFGPLLYDGRLRGLVFSQGRYWMNHRRIVGAVFRSPRFLRKFAAAAQLRTLELLDSVWMSRRPSRGAPITVNVHEAMRMLALDVIGDAAFGTQFGALQAGSHPIETSLGFILHGVLDVIKAPLPLWRVMRTPGRERIDRELQTLQAIELGLINERRQRLEQCPDEPADDFLAMLLKARDSETDISFDDEDLMWDVHDVIFAGHETTSSALAAALWLVAGSPRVEAEIRRELNRVLPDGRLPTMDDVAELRYLDMVFNEAMRLYPPTALVGRIAKEADVVCGYPVPAGANVLMSPYVMGRLERLWDNPEEFRPERFSPENIAKRHPMTHTPFGAGPRVCLGARMAMLEAKVVLATLFQRVSFQRTSDKLEVDYDSTVSFKSGMDMVVQEIRS